MNEQAEKKLKRDLIAAASLLVRERMDETGATGAFTGPTVHEGKLFDVHVRVVVSPLK